VTWPGDSSFSFSQINEKNDINDNFGLGKWLPRAIQPGTRFVCPFSRKTISCYYYLSL
jgi:hypothetical protein